MFPITGSFNNPGPLGGFLAAVVSFLVAFVVKSWNCVKSSFHLLTIRVATSAIVLSFFVLPLTMSRAGWLAMFVSLIYAVVTNENVVSWFSRHKCVLISLISASIILLSCTFFLKLDSALGRFHIWNIEARTIARFPFYGSGPNTAMGAYGREQELFFRENHSGPLAVKLAGCPEYPFNEYLGIGVETGVIGFLLSVVIVISAIKNLQRNNSVFLFGIVSLAVFALFSYPLRVPQTIILLTLFLSACRPFERSSNTCEIQWVMGLLLLSMVIFIAFVNKDRRDKWNMSNVDYLFNEGMFYRRNGLLEKSNELLTMGTYFSSDAMFHILIGRNYEDMGYYNSAMNEYNIAHYMVPCRVYPLQRMMLLYLQLGQKQAAIDLGKQIIMMPINDLNPNMVKIVDDTEILLDSLARAGIVP